MKTNDEIDEVIWLNEALDWRIENRDGGFFLYNGFGYTGRYDSLNAALRADAEMNNEPFDGPTL